MLDLAQISGRITSIERKLIIPPGESAILTGNNRSDWLYPTDDGTAGGAALTRPALFAYDPNNGYEHNEAGADVGIPYHRTDGTGEIDWAGAGDGDYAINIAGGVLTLSTFSIPDVESSTGANDLLVGHASDGSWDAQTFPFGLVLSEPLAAGFNALDGTGVVQMASGVSATVAPLKIIQVESADGVGSYAADDYVVSANGTGGTSLTPLSGLLPAVPDVEDSTGKNDLLVGHASDGGWDSQTFGFGVMISDTVGGGFNSVNGDGVVQVVSGTSVFVRDLAIVDILSAAASDGTSPYAAGNYAVAANGSGGTTLTLLSAAIAAYFASLTGYGGGGALHDDLTWY